MNGEKFAMPNGRRTVKRNERRLYGTARSPWEASPGMRQTGEACLSRFLRQYPDIILNTNRLISGTKIC
jgi:hypothetical protein